MWSNLPSPDALWLVGLTLCVGVLSTVLTAGAIRLARRTGRMAPADPWHGEPVALLGGAAVVLAWLPAGIWAVVLAPELLPLLAGAVFMSAVGLLDDLRPLSPESRLVIGTLAGLAMALAGVRFALPPELWPINVAITALWFVGLTNAFNLIDNMDGVLPGVAAIAAAFVGVLAIRQGQIGLAMFAAGLAGACIGFLRYNFAPAKIFLGDAGSIFLGFALAGMALLGSHANVSSVLFVFTVPTLLLAVPIFNVTFVVISRALSGVPIFRGRADHINYRLLAHGFSRPRAVLAVYGISLLSGGLALAQSSSNDLPLLVMGAGFFLVLSYVGIFLYEGRVSGFYEKYGLQVQSMTGTPTARVVLRTIAVLGDIAVLALGFVAALLLRYGGRLPAESIAGDALFPGLLAIRLVALLAMGSYSHVWRFLGLSDVLRVAFATALGTALVWMGAAAFGPSSPEPAFMMLEMALSGGFLGLARLLPRSLLEIARSRRLNMQEGRVPVLIVGAGEAGRLLLREIEANPQWEFFPVAFVDDDPAKLGRRIRGVRVAGTVEEAPSLVRNHSVKRVILTTPMIASERLEQVLEALEKEGCRCERLHVSLVPLKSSTAIPKPVENGSAPERPDGKRARVRSATARSTV